jgi:sugar lactone lactonase YvrE
MGQPSDTNPMRARERLRQKMLRCWACLCAVVWMAAGWGSAGRCAAQATALPLVLPSAMVFDAQGDLYFAETGNHVVRMFSTAGAVSIVAGDGVQGFAGDGGAATAAELDSPSGLAMDGAGNLYIADTHNHRVREVAAATGKITTVAGTGVAGVAGDGGAAVAAQLDRPTALAVDGAGDLFIADTDGHRVRKIAAATGVITTVAGDGVEGFSGDGGAAVAASIDAPNGLAVDGVGNLYIADTHNGRVREVSTATGLISTVAGVGGTKGNVQGFGGDGGAATAAGLALPRGLTLDAAGNLYVADTANHRVRRVSIGVISTVAGQGTEAFAGDGAPAVAASLNSPRAVAVSPAGLVTLADSGNQRVRQIDALAAPGPDIHTLAGLGETTPGSLLLSGPSVVAYGSGALTATVSGGGGNATGSVIFLELSGGATTQLGSAVLVSGSASYALGALGAGVHTIFATYGGDANHGAAQSSALAVTVTPLGLVAAVSPASILYGQAAPVLGGSLNGVLAQDAGKVSVGFSAGVGTLSPVGVYPITVTLTGSAAGNYAVTTTPASFTVAQAPTLTTLSASTNAPGLGAAVTFTAQAASTTSGTPTGSVRVLDGGSLIGTAALAGGSAAVSVSSLGVGSHSVTAVYSGDGNFLASMSAATVVTVGGATSDFSLSATGAAAQSVAAGSAAVFHFSVATQGAAMASPITLAVQGAPVGATVTLNPAYVPPGGGVTSFTLTVQTPLAEMRGPFGIGDGVLAALGFLLLPGVGLVARGRWRRMSGVLGLVVGFVVLAGMAMGCGNRVNTASEAVSGKSYTLTVTGAATSAGGAALLHSASVTLTVL